jgi:hypothetical protein
MNIPTILAIAVLACLAANALHWRGRRSERFLYYPGAGWLLILFVLWTAATAAGLYLAGLIPGLTFLVVGLGMFITHELYSIIRRLVQRTA